MNKPLDPRVVVPASDDTYSRWQTEYAEQIGVDGAVANRSGIPVKPLYTPADWDGSRYDADLGYPGQPP